MIDTTKELRRASIEINNLRSALTHWQRRVNELQGELSQLRLKAPEKHRPWTTVRPTITGPINLLDPPARIASQIQLHMVARSLANTCRYSGNMTQYYSVAEHCVVLSLMEEFAESKSEQTMALMHDAGEALYGDIIKPIRDQIRDPVMMRIIANVDTAMDLRFALVHSVKILNADGAIQAIEMKRLYGGSNHYDMQRSLAIPPDASARLKRVVDKFVVCGGGGLLPDEAYDLFMWRAAYLGIS